MPSKNLGRGRASSERLWDLEEIQELIDVLVRREITEFEMEKGGLRIRIKRGNSSLDTLGPRSFPEGSLTPVHSSPAPAPSPHAAGPAPTEPFAGESTEGLFMVKSPIVGTFYASPAPNAAPFVKLGDVVQVGQALCIIEAMKLMNEIESEVAGEVVRIYVENGQPVEYGQSLFAIKPSHKK